jgi:murein L,D-transpeptidase YafK
MPGVKLLAALLLVLAATAAAADAERWLLVDTQALTLTVMDGEWPQLTFHNLAIGRYGTSQVKHRGDHTTPLGRFRITRIERDATFHRFIALSYPDTDRADQAYREGVIGDAERRAILAAHRRGAPPPQSTALGGHIGIHGVGRGDPRLHRMMNWTKGCIALTDEQIDTLLIWVHVGMLVEIR